MVDSELLIYKLLNFGFGNLAIKLISSYFSNRKIDQVKSTKTVFLLEPHKDQLWNLCILSSL